MTRERHVHCIARVIKSVGTFIHEDYIGIGFKDRLDSPECCPVIHRHGVFVLIQTLCEFHVLGLCLFLKRSHPCRVGVHFRFGQPCENGIECQPHIADYRSCYRDIDINLLRLHIKLHELDGRIPFATAERKHPVETCARHNHHISLFHNGGAARQRTQRPVVGHQPLGH